MSAAASSSSPRREVAALRCAIAEPIALMARGSSAVFTSIAVLPCLAGCPMRPLRDWRATGAPWDRRRPGKRIGDYPRRAGEGEVEGVLGPHSEARRVSEQHRRMHE